ncbi:hypothetical protein IQ06DRAFT_341522 [Phaeosphaeriaceae sp. SRC1lsM3a]|nr:hypothetical protein IQ06DRAFT_341522 [Stagonospora sp. SRC1lsM3a]
MTEDTTEHELSVLETHQGWRPRRVESVPDFETVLQKCLAEGRILEHEYNSPEKRIFFANEYKMTIEQLVIDGDLIRNSESGSQHDGDNYTTSATARVSKHSGNPKGIYHRLNYSSTSVRKRLITVTGKGQSFRLTYSRRRNHHYFYLLSVARKRTVSFKCYAVCSLAHALLGTKSTLQRRLQKATKMLLDEDTAALLDLQTAWDMAAVA